MAAGTLINGVNYSWSNVTMVLYGIPVVGITKIEYSAKQKKDNNYGMGAEPVSRGYGHKEYSAKITVYRDEWNAIIKASPNFDPTQAAFSDIIVQFGGSRVSASTDILRAAEFLNDPFTVAQGDTKIMVDVELIIGGIEHVPAP